MSDPVAVNPHQVVAVASAPQPVADPVAAAEAAGAALAAAVIAPLAPEPSAGASAGGGGVGVDVGGSNPSTSHGGAPEHAPASRVSLPLEEFAEDLDLRLGRANGNIYQRREGIEGVHDGQVMVRLKKKRFIIIDYGIVPTEHDLQSSALNPHTTVPLGAGVTKCTGKVPSGPEPGAPLVSCKKIGVPVLLYDSEPEEPPSLYLRSGLCFTCQRNLNEKRRTQRKRPSDRGGSGVHAHAHAGNKDHSHASQAAFLAAQQQLAVTPGSTAALPGMQTVRIGGIGGQTNLVGAGSTGRVNATPHHRVLMAVTNGHKKIKLAHTNQPLVLAPDAIILNGPPDNHSCKSVRTGHGFAEIGADLGVEVHQSLSSAQALLHSVNTPEMIQQGIPPPTPDEISRTYDQAFYSLSKSLYLLVQWKTSWDAAVASAMQQEAAQQQQQQQAPPHPPPQHLQPPPPPPPQHHHPSAAAANAAALQQQMAAANAAATAAIGSMMNGVPGTVPMGHVMNGGLGVNVNVGVPALGPGVAPPPPSVVGVADPGVAQAVASAAAVAAAAGEAASAVAAEAVVAPGPAQPPPPAPPPQEPQQALHGVPPQGDATVEV